MHCLQCQHNANLQYDFCKMSFNSSGSQMHEPILPFHEDMTFLRKGVVGHGLQGVTGKTFPKGTISNKLST